MKLTEQELAKMQSVNIGAVRAELLADADSLRFDTSLSRRERLRCFLHKAVNPYCFCVGGVGVKIEFAEDGPPLQDALAGFLIRQRSGL